MMSKIIIYGTAYKAKKLCHYLQDDVEIIAFTESGCREERTLWNGKKCVPIAEALALNYEYIVIASSAYCEITSSLIAEGVLPENIIQAFNAHSRFPNTLFYYNVLDPFQGKVKIFKSLDCLVSEMY